MHGEPASHARTTLIYVRNNANMDVFNGVLCRYNSTMLMTNMVRQRRMPPAAHPAKRTKRAEHGPVASRLLVERPSKFGNRWAPCGFVDRGRVKNPTDQTAYGLHNKQMADYECESLICVYHDFDSGNEYEFRPIAIFGRWNMRSIIIMYITDQLGLEWNLELFSVALSVFDIENC